MEKLIKFWNSRDGKPVTLLLLTAVCLVLTVTMGYFHSRANDVGALAGQVSGTLVGAAIGSADGLINGTREGIEAGAAKGLSAEDTSIYIQDSMKQLGNLEVLAASVTLKNVNKVGEAYAELILMNGNAIFSVDMTQAEIQFSRDGKEVAIAIPEPVMELNLNEEKTQQLAEIQKFSFSVSAEDGLVEYLNSMAEIVQKAEEHIANYDSLVERAQGAAITQVQELAETISGGQYVVQVQIR